MIDLRFDMSDFERLAKQVGGAPDQIHYALANAMSAAAFKVREALIAETWAGHVQVRNRNFLRNALRIEKATKRNLSVAITTEGAVAGGRAHLSLHAKGGVKRSRGRLAIPPPGSVTRTSRGVRANQKPRALIDRTPKRALRITPKGIFVGEKGRLRLKYVFAGQAQIDKDVPFHEDFQRLMRAELRRTFPVAMSNAMKTRGLKSSYERAAALGRRSNSAHGNSVNARQRHGL